MKFSYSLLLVLPFAVACGGNEAGPQTPTTAASTAPSSATTPAPTDTTPAPTAAGTAASATTPPAAPVDISTAEKGRQAIYDALARNDKEGFRALVSKRMLESHKADFDAWYGAWQGSIGKVAPDRWKRITVKDDGGSQFKLDEN
ncbi:hypothetical protein BH09MYX1_BH09MYX1_22260 [soil metagenome]